MRKRQKNQPSEETVLTGDLITGPREYTVKNAFVHKGKALVPGEKVVLNDRQAEWLKGSDHI